MYDVILNDRVPEIKGYIKTTFRNESISELMRLERRGDRWILPLDETETEVPPPLDWLVEEVSFMGDVPAVPHREYGVYRHESARAQVTVAPGKPGGKAHVVGKSIADVRELYHRILAGSIRPEESYEKPQTGMSRKEMEEAFAKLKHDVRVFANILAHSRDYGRSWWPWCNRQKVVDEINRFLRWNGIEEP